MHKTDTNANDPALTDHNYDGIQEYDNPLPTWWTLAFYASIAWAILYFAGINLGLIATYEKDLETGQAELATMRQRHEDSQPRIIITEEMLAAVADDDARIQSGAKIFTAKCAACHGNAGQGLIGPNLTDKFWLHGGSMLSIHKVVDKGVAAKGMPAWSGALKPTEINDVVGYIKTLQGTNPEGAKAPQGSAYEPKANL